MSERRVIAMLSAGDRPWRDVTAQSFRRYAEKINAEMIVFDELPTLDDFPLQEPRVLRGRSNKRAYACKTYYVWRLLNEGYDRVLFVDDTCFIKKDAPDIFDIVPMGTIGGVDSSKTHAELSFGDIERMIVALNERPIEYDYRQYINSGVVVYDASSLEAFHPSNIILYKKLLVSKLPHQTLLYYLAKRSGINFTILPKSFNTVPAAKLDKEYRRYLEDIGPHLDPAAHIYHLTSIYRKRDLLLRQISQIAA